MFKNVASQSITVLAIDTSSNLPKTGDAANITLYYNGDNGGVTVFSTGSGHPAEDDATNAPGCYTIVPTQGETNFNKINITGKSSTSGIRVIPILNIQTVPAAIGIAGGAAGGLMIAGSNAATTLASLTVTAATVLTGNVSMAAGLTVTQSTANTAGIAVTGNGSGAGISVTGGAAVTTTPAGHGILVTGGASSTGAGGVAGNAINALGGAGSASTNGAAAGVLFTGGGTTTVSGNAGLSLAGSLLGAGLLATGGSTGHGISAVGGATSGDGFSSVATTSGQGATFTGAGTTKPGIKATGGATTSAGLQLAGGATSGDGLLVTATTLGHGFNVTGNGNAKHGALFTGNGGTGTCHGMSLIGGAGSTGGAGLSALGFSQGAGILTTGTGAGGHGISAIGTTSSSAGISATGATSQGPGMVLTGGDAQGGNFAGIGLKIIGGAASTSASGVAGVGLVVTGGAGAASTNGAAIGATFAGGGTNTVASAAHGVSITGTSTGNGLLATSGGGATGNGIGATAASTNGSGLACVSTGTGSGILTDKLTASAAVAFQSTFIVSTSTALGALSCSTLTASGAVAFQSTFAVTTSTALGAISGSTLTLSGAVAFQSTFIVTGATTLTGAVTATNAGNDIRGVVLTTSPPTAAAIATAVWQDATAGDFTTASSIGKSLYNAFTSNTSVFTTAALANAPTGGSAPTAAQVATAVWQDTTASSDFTTVGSIGKLLAALTFTVSNQLDVNVLSTAGTTVFNSDGTCANGSGSSSVFKFPTTDSAGNAIPDSSQYQWTTLRIVGGTGIGQVVNLTTATGNAREYTILSGTAPATVDNTSTYVLLGTWRANTTHLNGTAQTARDIGASVLVGDKTGFSLAAAGLDSVVIEAGLNARQAMSLIASACVGVLAGAATTTVTIKGAGVATQRVSATVDSNGNRSAVTLAPPA